VASSAAPGAYAERGSARATLTGSRHRNANQVGERRLGWAGGGMEAGNAATWFPAVRGKLGSRPITWPKIGIANKARLVAAAALEPDDWRRGPHINKP